MSRLQSGEKLPQFTSCCPSWVRYAELNYPQLVTNISSCRSPMQMFASVLKEHYKNSKKRVVVVAVMPCTAKKYEAARDEFKENGVPYVDYVITTQEIIKLIQEANLVFTEIDPEAVDMPFGTMSGAGVIFGVNRRRYRGCNKETECCKIVFFPPINSFYRNSWYAGNKGNEHRL